MNTKTFLRGLLLAGVACLTLTGCFGFLKPAKATARKFVLAALPAPDAAPVPSGLAVGVAQVKLPDYLFNTSLAIRQGANEVDYSQLTLWAERLDAGVQRALAANLAVLLPSNRIRLNAWRSEDVNVEVHVALERFDVDGNGQAVLVAWWRILSPGGDQTYQSGETRLQRAGPSPYGDPAGAIANLNSLLTDFSRQLAEVTKAACPAPAAK